MNRIPIKPANLGSSHLSPLPYRRATFFQSSVAPRILPAPFSRRNHRMSSTSATKNEYLVILPDHANSLHKRLAVRPRHLEKLTPHVQSGDVVFGGATLSRHPKEGEQPDMIGSAMLIKAESEEAVRVWLANDEYAKGGVWNVDEAKIYPFRCAVRTAM
jgi:uncharacterized protein